MYVHEMMQAEVFGRPVTWSQVAGEVQELAEAIGNLDVENVREEVSDVACFGHLWVWQLLGSPTWSWPAWGAGPSIEKFLRRMDAWREIFQAEGLEFRPRYLVAGGNHKKPEKVAAALAAARAEGGA